MRRQTVAVAAITVAISVVTAVAGRGLAAPFETEAERSGFVRTGRLDEVLALCAAAERDYPGRARCVRVGTSPEGRPLVALAASADGVLDPQAARDRRRPVVLVIAGIHAGEIEGKDAGFLMLRGLLDGSAARGALDAVTLLFVPVFNVDGHERFSRHGRPNQRGPEEKGFRGTAQNLNLNRDWVKADAPEMLLMLGLLEAWDPVVVMDLHTTDGAKFQHDISVIVAPDAARPDGLDELATVLSAAIQRRLAERGHLPLPFYPAFREDDDPSSGFERVPSPPRFSDSYVAVRNRIGVLVETHSWKPYAERVAATRDTIVAVLEEATREARGWRAAADAADAQSLAGADATLLFDAEPRSRRIDFLGYAYRVEKSALSGGRRIIYDESKKQVWRVPLHDVARPVVTVRAPRGGYVVPAAWAARVERTLRAHGVTWRRLDAATTFTAQVFELTRREPQPTYEGRAPLKVGGAWGPAGPVRAAPGSLFVPIAQPRGRLVLHLFEPEAPDSFVSWGDFNVAFEEKEYIEDYVLEDEARAMLARDPALKAAFEKRLREDRAFARSPEARLRFFQVRHPSFEVETRRVPLWRVEAAP